MAYDIILRYDDLNDTSTETYGLFEANLWDEIDSRRQELARLIRFDKALQQRLQSNKTMTEFDFACCVNLFEIHRDWTPEQIFERIFGGK